MKFRIPLILLLVLSAGLALGACSRLPKPETSCGFVQNSETQRVSWKRQLPIALYVHESVPVDAYGALDRAIAEYNSVMGTEVFRVVARGVSGPLNPQKDGFSTIYWYNTWDPNRPDEQARTTIYWTGSEIFEADMRVNAANFSYNYGTATSFQGVDLQSLFTHELGHVLGLAHIVTPGSVMFFRLDNDQVRRQLGAVDLSDLKCEY